MLIPKRKYVRSKDHLKFVASLPCVICGAGDVQAAHIRTGNGSGMGLKPGDDCVVSLCVEHHRKQHEIGEIKFWKWHLDDAKNLANALWVCTNDYQRGLELVLRFQKVIRK